MQQIVAFCQCYARKQWLKTYNDVSSKAVLVLPCCNYCCVAVLSGLPTWCLLALPLWCTDTSNNCLLSCYYSSVLNKTTVCKRMSSVTTSLMIIVL